MARFYSADHHFGHARIIELCARPFRSVADMNELILANAWEMVGPDDDFYLLGDLAMGSLDDSLSVVSRLPGRKTLILGNHDRPFNEKTQPRRDAARRRYEDAGLTVADSLVVADRIGGRDVLLSHFPYAGDSHSAVDRYAEVRPRDEGLPIIHGHVHTSWHIDGRQYNVGVDVNGFRPVPEDVLAAWIAGLPDTA